MDTIFFTNLLFATLSIFLIFLTIGVVFLFIAILSALKSIRSFFIVIRRESEKMAEDIETMKEKMKSSEAMVVSFIVYLTSLFRGHQKKVDGKKK